MNTGRAKTVRGSRRSWRVASRIAQRQGYRSLIARCVNAARANSSSTRLNRSSFELRRDGVQQRYVDLVERRPEIHACADAQVLEQFLDVLRAPLGIMTLGRLLRLALRARVQCHHAVTPRKVADLRFPHPSGNQVQAHAVARREMTAPELGIRGGSGLTQECDHEREENAEAAHGFIPVAVTTCSAARAARSVR